MASIMPKTQREQLMVLLGILGLAAAGLYWYYVFDPGTAAIGVTADHVDKLDKNNQAAKTDMAKGTVNELRAQAQQYQDNLQLMRQLVPAANEVTTLLDQVSSSARRVGLDVSKIEPLGTEQGQDFDAYKYRFSMTGGYHAVAEFLANVGSLRRIVVPVNVNMVTAQGQNLGPNRTTTTTFELHTYVARTAPPPSAAKPKAPPAAGAAPAKGGE